MMGINLLCCCRRFGRLAIGYVWRQHALTGRRQTGDYLANCVLCSVSEVVLVRSFARSFVRSLACLCWCDSRERRRLSSLLLWRSSATFVPLLSVDWRPATGLLCDHCQPLACTPPRLDCPGQSQARGRPVAFGRRMTLGTPCGRRMRRALAAARALRRGGRSGNEAEGKGALEWGKAEMRPEGRGATRMGWKWRCGLSVAALAARRPSSTTVRYLLASCGPGPPPDWPPVVGRGLKSVRVG